MAKKKSVKKAVKAVKKKSAGKAAAPKPGPQAVKKKTSAKAKVKKKAVKQTKAAKKKQAAPKKSKQTAIDRISDVLQFPAMLVPEDLPRPPAIVLELLESIGIKNPGELDLSGVEDIARKLSGHPQWEEFRAGLLQYFGMTGDEWYMKFDDDQPPMCYEVKVVLRHTKPAVERVLHLPEMSFGELHDCIQVAMGWENCHLHEFEVGEDRVGPVPDEGELDAWEHDPDVLPEEDVAIGQAWQAGLKRIRYVYDFGDGWEHDVALVKAWRMNGDRPTPKCLSGKLACPPEDCGGVSGYAELAELQAIPEDELSDDERERLEWLGEWDPQRFDLDEVNQVFARWNDAPDEGDDGKADDEVYLL